MVSVHTAATQAINTKARAKGVGSHMLSHFNVTKSKKRFKKFKFSNKRAKLQLGVVDKKSASQCHIPKVQLGQYINKKTFDGISPDL